MSRSIIFAFFSIAFFNASTALCQTIIPTTENYSLKLGVKLSADKSNDYKFSQYNRTVISGGIPVCFRLNYSRIDIESGLFLINKAITTSSSEYYLLNNLSVPLCIRYNYKSAYVSGGLYLDYLFNYIDNTETISFEEISLLRSFYVGGSLSIGIETNFIKNYNIFAERRGLYNFTSTLDHKRSSSFNGLISYGVSIGMNYRFY